jgi:thiaminase/transcriptional activator TenA
VTFSERLWSGIQPTYDAILRHPFVTGLTDGSLDPAAFAFYVVQDALYLADYARALAVVGAKAPTPGDVAMFARHAAGAVEVERTLHDSLLADLGIDAAQISAAEPAPTNLAYTSYLLARVHNDSFAVGLAAVLPCYWIYAEVGRELLAKGSPDARYQRWIDTYSGEEFARVVREVLDLADRVGESLSAEVERAAHDAFRTTARYEWMFWDMGLRRETWPEMRGAQ